jgi:hypothetical protein
MNIHVCNKLIVRLIMIIIIIVISFHSYDFFWSFHYSLLFVLHRWFIIWTFVIFSFFSHMISRSFSRFLLSSSNSYYLHLLSILELAFNVSVIHPGIYFCLFSFFTLSRYFDVTLKYVDETHFFHKYGRMLGSAVRARHHLHLFISVSSSISPLFSSLYIYVFLSLFSVS